MRCIGIDIGYGRTKTYAGKSLQDNCPSVVSSQVPTRTFGDTVLNPIGVDGVDYIVGYEAETHARSAEDTRRTDYLGSRGWFALLGNALRVAHFNSATDAIAIGLPPADLGPEKEEMVRRKMRETPMTVKSTGETYLLDQTRVFIVPQGAGIYFSYAINNGDALEKDVAVIDIGHQTVDLIFMSKGRYIETMKETKDLGTSRELDAIIQLERSRLRGKRLRYSDVAARMSKGRGLITPGAADHIPGALEVLQGYTRTVVSTIEAYIDMTRGADLCLIGGGGARLLVPDHDYDLLVVDEPEMANAIGYWAWAISHI
jgi:hypothetical protein